MKLVIILQFLSLLILPVFGENFYIEEHNYSVYIPEGWNTYDSSNLAELSFVSDDEVVMFQISTFDGEEYNSAEQIFMSLTEDFGSNTVGSEFLFNGQEAYIADISFTVSGDALRGWFLCINRDDFDYYLFSFCGEDYYEEKLPFILSCIDSFRFEEKGSIMCPGAISQFYYPFPGNNLDTAQIVINGNIVTFQTDLLEFEASQLVIEREASMMIYYQDLGDIDLFTEAWRRYYRVIYRDNFNRFFNFSEALKKVDIGSSDREKSIILLDWIQNFKYESSETFSDLLSPISSVCYEKGDCDARGLSYSILLKHFNIESLLMVSWQYKHSMSAVNIEGEGARYPFENDTYLIAETTEIIDIGMIPQTMADGEKWIAVSFF